MNTYYFYFILKQLPSGVRFIRTTRHAECLRSQPNRHAERFRSKSRTKASNTAVRSQEALLRPERACAGV
jgi:hypothetical protein